MELRDKILSTISRYTYGETIVNASGLADELVKIVEGESKHLSFSGYSEEAGKTAIYPERGRNLPYPVLGLVGEAGEVAEKVKKMIRDDNGWLTLERRTDIIKELGDVLWYVAAVCYELRIKMEEVARRNLVKLAERQKKETLRGDGDNR